MFREIFIPIKGRLLTKRPFLRPKPYDLQERYCANFCGLGWQVFKPSFFSHYQLLTFLECRMATIIVTILRETEIETERVNGLVVYISLINFFASRFSIKLFSKLDIERCPKIFPFFYQTRNSIRYFFF